MERLGPSRAKSKSTEEEGGNVATDEKETGGREGGQFWKRRAGREGPKGCDQ